MMPPRLADAEATIADPAASPERLAKLFQQLYPVGLGRHASDALFDESRRLIWLLARNPNTPPMTLASIASMSYPSARAVARNPGFSLALLIDPLCRDTTNQQMVYAVTQRWPSDNELHAAVLPPLERSEEDPALAASLDAINPLLRQHFRGAPSSLQPRALSQPQRQDRLRNALMQAAYSPHEKGSPLGSDIVHCVALLGSQARLEHALATRLGLRFERWYEGLSGLFPEP